jgi:integrase
VERTSSLLAADGVYHYPSADDSHLAEYARTQASAKWSHAALLIGEGVHPKVIQERFGHTSIGTTLDLYGHLFEGLDEAAASALDGVFSAGNVDTLSTQDAEKVVSITAGQ